MIVRRALRRAKRVLAAAGLVKQPVHLDFGNRLTSSKHVDAMLARLTDVITVWLSGQTILPAPAPFDVRREVGSFYEAYLASPFRGSFGGSRFNKLLWLTILAKALRPAHVIDSGTYMGASAWALSLGAPEARILSFDVDLSQLRSRVASAEYHQHDWSKHDLTKIDPARTFCYFDDHIDQVRRLLEAKERKIPFAAFDDDLPVSCFAIMAPSPARLPKLEFIDDPTLQHGDVVEWTWNGAPRRWIVDRAYLDSGRAAIKAAERLPELGTITGIRVLSPKLVALRL